MRLRQFLDEKRMNPTEFKKTAARQSSNAKVGFEFECVIPTHSILHGGGVDMRDYERLDRIMSLEELREYFHIHPNYFTRLDREFDSWGDEVMNHWVADNMDVDPDLVDSEGQKYAEKDAREKAEDEFNSEYEKLRSFWEFINTEYRSLYKFIEHHGLTPIYGWEADTGNDSARVYVEGASGSQSEEAQKQTFSKIETELSDYLGQPVTMPWKDSHRHYDAGEWLVVPDGSIEAHEGAIAAEINSPPAPLKEALQNLQMMFLFMKEHHIETNSSTGLHINISMPGIEDVDLVKLVLFMGDKYVLKQFDRLNNTFTKPQTMSILNNVAGSGTLPKEAKEMIRLAQGALSHQKYSSVHIEKLADGYLEFRIAGGANYQKDFEKISDTVLRFVSALEVAMDPKAERKEYLKKLATILQKGAEGDQNDDFNERPLADILDFAGQEDGAKLLATYMADAKAGKLSGPSAKDRMTAWFNDVFLRHVFWSFSELGIKKPSERHRAEVRLIMKKLGVDPESIQAPADPWKADILRRLGLRK